MALRRFFNKIGSLFDTSENYKRLHDEQVVPITEEKIKADGTRMQTRHTTPISLPALATGEDSKTREQSPPSMTSTPSHSQVEPNDLGLYVDTEKSSIQANIERITQHPNYSQIGDLIGALISMDTPKSARTPREHSLVGKHFENKKISPITFPNSPLQRVGNFASSNQRENFQLVRDIKYAQNKTTDNGTEYKLTSPDHSFKVQFFDSMKEQNEAAFLVTDDKNVIEVTSQYHYKYAKQFRDLFPRAALELGFKTIKLLNPENQAVLEVSEYQGMSPSSTISPPKPK